jgi:hypothetical protein
MTQPPDEPGRHAAPDPEVDPEDVPKLTAEEWAYIAAMSPQDDDQDPQGDS